MNNKDVLRIYRLLEYRLLQKVSGIRNILSLDRAKETQGRKAYVIQHVKYNNIVECWTKKNKRKTQYKNTLVAYIQ